MDPQIGLKLRKIRKTMGVHRDQFALLIGVPRTTLKNYERGQREFRASALISVYNNPALAGAWNYLVDSRRAVDSLVASEVPAPGCLPAPSVTPEAACQAGLKMAALRERAGIERKGFAALLSVSVDWLRRFESGRHDVGANPLAAICCQGSRLPLGYLLDIGRAAHSLTSDEVAKVTAWAVS